jgi:hypothetical protein
MTDPRVVEDMETKTKESTKEPSEEEEVKTEEVGAAEEASTEKQEIFDDKEDIADAGEEDAASEDRTDWTETPVLGRPDKPGVRRLFLTALVLQSAGWLGLLAGRWAGRQTDPSSCALLGAAIASLGLAHAASLHFGRADWGPGAAQGEEIQ